MVVGLFPAAISMAQAIAKIPQSTFPFCVAEIKTCSISGRDESTEYTALI